MPGSTTQDEGEYEEVADTPNPKLYRISQVDVMEQGESYRGNSPKEELVLEYVENFRRQFVDIYPNRRELLLTPLNECGVKVPHLPHAPSSEAHRPLLTPNPYPPFVHKHIII